MIFMAGQFQCPAAMQGIFNLTIIVMMICSSVILKEKISGKKFLGACIFIAALFVIACN